MSTSPTESNSSISPTRLSPAVVALLLFAFAFALRAPFATRGNLSPDAVDYLDIARNIAEGRGVTQSIKWHFFTDAPAPRPAWGERPVLLPMVLAPLIALGFDSLITLQGFNAALGALGVALLYLWARGSNAGQASRLSSIVGQASRLSPTGEAENNRRDVPSNDRRDACPTSRETIGIAAAVLLALNPAAIMCSAYVWTEPLFVVLLLLTFMALGPRANGTPAPTWRAALAGVLAALCYYARPTAILLLPAVTVWTVAGRQWRAGAVFAVVMVALIAPHFALVGRSHDSPFYSIQGQHLRVGHIEDAMARGYGRTIPTAGRFIADNAGAVAQAIWGHSFEYARDFVSLQFFSALSFFAIAALAIPSLSSSSSSSFSSSSAPRSSSCATAPWTPAIVFAVLNFLAVSLIWAAPVDSNRFLLIPFACLLPPALSRVGEWCGRDGQGGWNGRNGAARQKRLALALVVGFVVVFYGALDWQLYQGVVRNARQRPASEAFARFARALPPDALLAATDPFTANFLFRRPTIVLPETTNASLLKRFVAEYRPDHILGPPSLEERLTPLTGAGIVGVPFAPPDSPFLWWPVKTD